MNVLKVIMVSIIIIPTITMAETIEKEINTIEFTIENKCKDFGTSEYFDLERKNTCLNVLKLGVEKEIKKAEFILGQAMYNGFNLPMNKELGQRLIIKNKEK